MKKIIGITILSIMVLVGSSFKTGAPAPATSPVSAPVAALAPPHTLVDITNPPSCYAIKVRCPSYFGSDECIVYNPDNTSVWNMTEFYSDFAAAFVFIKWYSWSSWVEVGFASTIDDFVTVSWINGYVSSMSFGYDDIQDP
jgi:hypothetical protein